MNQETQNTSGQTIVIQQEVVKKNGLGTAGFILALIAIFIGWIPIIGWIVWLLGLILSAAGMSKKPKGLATAGLVISLIGVVILLLIFFGAMGAASTAALAS